jgi:hypothetical protein
MSILTVINCYHLSHGVTLISNYRNSAKKCLNTRLFRKNLHVKYESNNPTQNRRTIFDFSP